MEKLRDNPEVIFGCSSFCDVPAPHAQAHFTSPETALPVLNLLRDKSVKCLDTARGYPVGAAGGSERLLGNLGVGQQGFTIDTKVQSWAPGSHTAEKVAKSIEASLDALKMPKVHVMYLHFPDRATPFEVTCRAMDKAYREGKFQKFGISNYTAEEVERIIAICEKEGLVKPSVYQGRYNALVRSGEEALFPLLRKHKMSFYAYSPSAAGLFSGNVTKDSTQVAGSRWDTTTILGKSYSAEYFNDKVFAASTKLQTAAKEEGLSGHAVALRWIMYHSSLSGELGDKIIIGASNLEQLKQNLDFFEQGSLSEKLLKAVNEVWEMAKDTAPVYHR